MLKKCFFLSFCFIALNAATINGIAILVDKKPITLFDIEKTMQSARLSKQEAIDTLINDKIEEIQAENMGIIINDYDVENEIKRILSNTQSTQATLEDSLKARGQSLESFKTELKEDLQKRKLYEAIASSAKVDFSEEGARSFYESHANEFLIFTKITALVYTSSVDGSLENFLSSGKKTSDIKEARAVLNVENSDPRLLGYLSRFELGNFSSVIDIAQEHFLYKILAKDEPQSVDFNQAKNEIINAYVMKQRDDFLKDFFSKLRVKTQIKYLR